MKISIKITVLLVLTSCQFDLKNKITNEEMKYQEKWDFYFCQVDNEKGSIYMDFGFKDVAPIKKLPLAYWFTLSMNNPRTDGLSSSVESEKLFEIEDGLLKILSNKIDFKYVGRLTNHSKRFFYFYVADTVLIDKLISDYMVKYQDYKYELDYKSDKDWEIYLNFLYPSPKEYQSLMNRRVIDNLEKNGDKLEKPREVDHWIYFKRKEDLELFLDKIKDDGFTVVTNSFNKDYKEYPYTLQIKRVDKVDWSSIDEYVLCLWELANETNGDYDGWETQILKDR